MSTETNTQTSTPDPAPEAAATVTVCFYASAAEAAGAEQLTFRLQKSPTPLDEFIAALPALLADHQASTARAQDPPTGNSSPSLERVCGRSSFLINGTRVNPERAVVHHGDQLDILPPFAGG
ncbi:MoaD/ThiS family protein [Nesterenkonia alba]|uniref:MoaD/ThiS family protein n=1 Tax=Nesterenkonia alba TaxID=515814 RepID=UPI0003B48AD7|nr:MoaD/ThiS family protein [Nesterenkonia alba]